MQILIRKLTEDEIVVQNIREWPVWSCGISEFDWEYDEKECCLMLEGEVEISTDDVRLRIQAGDFVEFPRGLECHWNVLKAVRKHYRFG